MAQIKGTAVRGLLKHAKESYPGGIDAVLATLAAPTRALFDQRILASSWCPYPAYTGLLAALADRHREGRERATYLHELGRWAAAQDAGTTFKIVSMFASVETMLQRASLFWSRHCDTGVFETTDVQKGSGAGVLREFPDVHPLHCTLLGGWIEGMGEAAGARRATTTKVKCVHRGDRWCEYRGVWI
jgi:hypothetical protein